MSNKSFGIKKKHTSVSLITVTQLIRFDCLLNLYELIKLQTYKHIIEWVIVEGSLNVKDGLKNKINIEKIINKENKFKIKYIEYTGKLLSDLRNLGNNKCIGDIIVCMDDDDYYPIERVEHAVESLENSPCQIAGCSDIYMYEYFMGKLYKFKGFNQNHSTNNCLAFKKEYLINNKHDSNLHMAEEKSFTNNFTNPMVQLISNKCIIVSSHNFNTFNKRELCVCGTIGINPSLFEVEHPITNYIPTNIFNKMESLFYKEEDSIYDIVYLIGGLSVKWDPTDESLGGSEQAIVQLSESWVKMNKKVAVYGDMINNSKFNINGVDYINWKLFEFNHNFKIVILWRTYGIFCFLPFKIKAKKIFIDLHDNFQEQEQLFTIYKKYSNKITKLLFKSDFHKSEFEKVLSNKLDKDKYIILPNGINISEFSNNWDNVNRNLYRFCYVSYYTRGLEQILKHIWPIIKKLEPKCELHLYYGLDMCKDNTNLVEYYKTLIGSSSGVIDHGRLSIKYIVREKYLSSFQLYITSTRSEIDCISIRESLVTGCIPLISNYGIFSCREGIHFDLIDNDINSLENIASSIVKLFKNEKQLEHFRQLFKKSDTIISWEEVARQLLNIFS